jgi:hypothetical protein
MIDSTGKLLLPCERWRNKASKRPKDEPWKVSKRDTRDKKETIETPITAREKNRATKEQRTSHTTSAERKKENRDKVRTTQKPKYETRKNNKAGHKKQLVLQGTAQTKREQSENTSENERDKPRERARTKRSNARSSRVARASRQGENRNKPTEKEEENSQTLSQIPFSSLCPRAHTTTVLSGRCWFLPASVVRRLLAPFACLLVWQKLPTVTGTALMENA